MDKKKSFIQQVVDEDIFIGEKWWDDLREEIVNLLTQIKKLVDGIEIAIHLLRDTGMTNDGKEKLEMIKKLIKKEER